MLLMVALVVSPLIVDMSSVPQGWELPKVWFWQWVMVVLICIGFIRMFANFVAAQELRRRQYILLFVIIMLVVLWLMFPLFTQTEWQGIKLWGNEFRYHGFFTAVGTFLLGVQVATFWKRDSLTEKVLAAWLIASLVQAAIGTSQILDLFFDNGEFFWSFTDYIYGSFGQPNFFAGKLLLGVAVSIYFFKRIKDIPYRLILSAVILWFGVVIFFSQSTWALVGLAILLMTVLLRILSVVFRIEKLWWIYMLGSRLMLFFLPFLIWPKIQSLEVNDHRIFIWRRSIFAASPQNLGEAANLVFGYGFDFLAERISKLGLGEGAYIDRAHNLFIDILFNMGLAGWALLTSLLGWFYWTLKNLDEQQIYLLLVLDTLLIRAVVHTNSIINIVDLTIAFAMCFALIFSQRRSNRNPG